MKTKYTSPKVTVEELTRIDVLCNSTETNMDPNSIEGKDNANQLYTTLSSFF